MKKCIGGICAIAAILVSVSSAPLLGEMKQMERLRPERAVKPASESERGWGPASSYKGPA